MGQARRTVPFPISPVANDLGQHTSCPQHQTAALLHRFGRLYLVLTAVAVTSGVFTPTNPAFAAPRHTMHPGHSTFLKIAAKPARSTRQRHHRQAQVHSTSVRTVARTAGMLKRSASVVPHTSSAVPHCSSAVHRGVVPLANTTWDNPNVPPAMMNAIQAAAQDSGVDPHLLAAIAWRESRFDPNAGNRHSSAKGLLQFTTGTWLQVVRDFGSRHDVGDYAAAISKDPSGALVVHGRGMRTAILQLRSDPVLSAKLAAESMQQQRAAMQERLGRNVTAADLYLLHVLGPNGAARFLTAMAQHPSASSLEVASLKVLRNAGLLASDGRPMSVANTYAAAGAMLEAQHGHFEPMLVATGAKGDVTPAAPVEVSQAP